MAKGGSMAWNSTDGLWCDGAYKCGTELDSDDVKKYHDEIPTFTSIKPSCEQCGKWIYGKAKKPSRQAKTSGGAKKRKASQTD